jgi:hypothetical protein
MRKRYFIIPVKYRSQLESVRADVLRGEVTQFSKFLNSRLQVTLIIFLLHEFNGMTEEYNRFSSASRL